MQNHPLLRTHFSQYQSHLISCTGVTGRWMTDKPSCSQTTVLKNNVLTFCGASHACVCKVQNQHTVCVATHHQSTHSLCWNNQSPKQHTLCATSNTLVCWIDSLEPRLSVPDFVSQLWGKIGSKTSDFSPKLQDKIQNGKPGFEATELTPSHVCWPCRIAVACCVKTKANNTRWDTRVVYLNMAVCSGACMQ